MTLLKKTILLLSFLLSLPLVSCHHGDKHSEGEKEEKHEGEIEFHDEIAEEFGVAFDTLRISPFRPAMRLTGRVVQSPSDFGVVSAPRAGTVRLAGNVKTGAQVGRGQVIATVDATTTAGGDVNAAASANLKAAQREVDRLKPLYDEHLVTASEYNAALANLDQAKAAFVPAASSGRATAPISGVITALAAQQGQYVEAGAPIATIASSNARTIQIEVPRKEYHNISSLDNILLEIPGHAQPVSLGALNPRRVAGDAALNPDANSAFLPVMFNIDASADLPAGTVFTAFMNVGQGGSELSLPLTAISEQQGEYFVYERIHPEHYAKRPVTLGESNGTNVVIVEGLKPGAVVVTKGVTAIRLAETSATAPEGHSHNH